MLARTERYGGANNFRSDSPKVIGVSLGNNVWPPIQAAGASLGHQIVDDPIPAAPHLVAQLLIVHELAHSFHLGDEYGSPIAARPPHYDPPRIARETRRTRTRTCRLGHAGRTQRKLTIRS